MEAGPQAGCVAAYAIGAWTHRAGGSEKAFTICLSMATCVSDVPLTALGQWRCGAVPTQFKATQLVVAIAVWANAISARGAHPNLSILLLNNASEQYYITIG